MDPQVYRVAPEVEAATPQPRRSPRWLAFIAALVVMSATTLLNGALLSQARFEVDLLAIVVTVIGVAVVVGLKLVYAAWKKRHDAKLMLEWERWLEGKR